MGIKAVHLVYQRGLFPAQEKWVAGVGWEWTPALVEETLCTTCLRDAWHLTAMENNQDIVLAAKHQTKKTHLCERVDLLEEGMIGLEDAHCGKCGKLLKGETT